MSEAYDPWQHQELINSGELADLNAELARLRKSPWVRNTPETRPPDRIGLFCDISVIGGTRNYMPLRLVDGEFYTMHGTRFFGEVVYWMLIPPTPKE